MQGKLLLPTRIGAVRLGQSVLTNSIGGEETWQPQPHKLLALCFTVTSLYIVVLLCNFVATDIDQLSIQFTSPWSLPLLQLPVKP
jgi:hypothetical protein